MTDDTPTQIDPSELPYLQRVYAQAEEAKAMLAQAEELQAQALARRGAHDSYLLFLFDKYGLDPAGDRIDADGTLVRAATETNPTTSKAAT